MPPQSAVPIAAFDHIASLALQERHAPATSVRCREGLALRLVWMPMLISGCAVKIPRQGGFLFYGRSSGVQAGGKLPSKLSRASPMRFSSCTGPRRARSRRTLFYDRWDWPKAAAFLLVVVLLVQEWFVRPVKNVGRTRPSHGCDRPLARRITSQFSGSLTASSQVRFAKCVAVKILLSGNPAFRHLGLQKRRAPQCPPNACPIAG